MSAAPAASRAVERVKLMKLLWDAIGSEFGARHELYEVNYSGSHEEIRRYAIFGAHRVRPGGAMEGFRRSCMAEYDLDGWTVPDLINPGDVQRAALSRSDRACRTQFGACRPAAGKASAVAVQPISLRAG